MRESVNLEFPDVTDLFDLFRQSAVSRKGFLWLYRLAITRLVSSRPCNEDRKPAKYPQSSECICEITFLWLIKACLCSKLADEELLWSWGASRRSSWPHGSMWWFFSEGVFAGRTRKRGVCSIALVNKLSARSLNLRVVIFPRERYRLYSSGVPVTVHGVLFQKFARIYKGAMRSLFGSCRVFLRFLLDSYLNRNPMRICIQASSVSRGGLFVAWN